jgi:hypothetical protein
VQFGLNDRGHVVRMNIRRSYMADNGEQNMLSYISTCQDPAKLRQICINARSKGNQVVEDAASLRLYEILPAAEPGSFEHDVWKSIHALEHSLTTERGKTTRLQRTRNSIAAKGELATVAGLLNKKKASEGFGMLIERRMPELTFEELALRHPDRFTAEQLESARVRLKEVDKA